MTGVGPLELLNAALKRAGQPDGEARSEATSGERSASPRYAELSPPSMARLYGPHGLLADERPPGGAGLATSVSADGEVLAHQPGPAIDLGRLPQAPLPKEAAGLERAARRREELARAQAERRAERQEARRAARDERPHHEPELSPKEGEERAQRYLDVERGKHAIPFVTPHQGSRSYRRQSDDDERGIVRRKPAPSAPRPIVEADE